MSRIGKVPGAAYSYQCHRQLSATLYPKVQNCTPRYIISQPAVRYCVPQGTELYTKVHNFTASCPLLCTPRYRTIHQITEFHGRLSAALYAQVQNCTPRYRVSQPAVPYLVVVRQNKKFHSQIAPYLVRQGTELYTKVQLYGKVQFHSQLSATLYCKVQSFTAKPSSALYAKVQFHSQLSATLYAKVQSCIPKYSFTASCPLSCIPRYRVSQPVIPQPVHQGTTFHSQLSATLYTKVQSFTASCPPPYTSMYKVSQPAVRYLVH